MASRKKSAPARSTSSTKGYSQQKLAEAGIIMDGDVHTDDWLKVECDDEMGIYKSDEEAARAISAVVLGYIPELDMYMALDSEQWNNSLFDEAEREIVVPNPKHLSTWREAMHNATDHNLKTLGLLE